MPDDETVNQMIARHEEEFDLFMVGTVGGGGRPAHLWGRFAGVAHPALLTSSRIRQLSTDRAKLLRDGGVSGGSWSWGLSRGAPCCLLTDLSSSHGPRRELPQWWDTHMHMHTCMHTHPLCDPQACHMEDLPVFLIVLSLRFPFRGRSYCSRPGVSQRCSLAVGKRRKSARS